MLWFSWAGEPAVCGLSLGGSCQRARHFGRWGTDSGAGHDVGRTDGRAYRREVLHFPSLPHDGLGERGGSSLVTTTRSTLCHRDLASVRVGECAKNRHTPIEGLLVSLTVLAPGCTHRVGREQVLQNYSR